MFKSLYGILFLIAIATRVFPAWDASNYINATHIQVDVTALGLSGDVNDFPLLVRVTSATLSNFFGSNTQNDGDDVRFTDVNGDSLAFELEHWDDAGGSAAFWVLIPRVTAAGKIWITMYWNYSGATSASQPENVFLTANGFAGVWHLGDDPNGDPANSILDATGNQNHGDPEGAMLAEDLVTGAVGQGIEFDGIDDGIAIPEAAPLMSGLSNFSVSYWAEAAAYILNKAPIALSDNFVWAEEFVFYAYDTDQGNGARVFFNNNTPFDQNDGNLAGTGFHMFTYVSRSSTEHEVYVDGVLIGTGTVDVTLDSELDQCNIGMEKTGAEHYAGTLDEMRLSSTARSPDWIKLNFETQKQGQTVVTIIDENYSSWSFSKNLTLNTSSSGANVTTGAVENFPLLVRLDQSNFDFTEAQGTDGNNIRFSNSQGHPLYYEIERWDNTARLAEIWVKVETVLPSHSTQYITMYWDGNSRTSRSDGEPVFYVNNGFAGVWHLNSGDFSDATANNNHGTDNVSATGTGGVIGTGQELGIDDDYILVSDHPSLDITDQITISLWIRPHSDITGWDTFIDKGWRTAWAFQNFFGSTNRLNFAVNNTDLPQADSNSYTPNQWNLIAVTYDKDAGGTDEIKFYSGGVLVGTADYSTALGTNNTNLLIGSNSGSTTDGIDGELDEVRVSSSARSAEWIKLSYENQKPGGGLINFVQGPILGITVDHVIPSGSIRQLPDGMGSVEITFRAKTVEGANITLEEIRYNTGQGWNTIPGGSSALPNGWNTTPYTSGTDFSGTQHKIIIATGQIDSLAGKSFPAVQFSLKATGGEHATTSGVALDNEFPIIAIANQTTPLRSPRISGTSSEQLILLTITINGEAHNANLLTATTFELAQGTLTDLANGTYNIQVTATDLQGNAGNQTFIDALIVDNQVPQITVNAVITTSLSPALSGTVTAGAVVTIEAGGETHPATVTDTTWSLPAGTFLLLSEGVFDVIATAATSKGVGVDGTTGELIIDRTPPEIDVTNLITNSTNPVIYGATNETLQSLTVNVNNLLLAGELNRTAWQTPDSSLTGLVEGNYPMIIMGTDLAGNVTTQGTDTLVIDRTNPLMVAPSPHNILTTLLPDLRIQFNEDVKAGTGALTLVKSADSSIHGSLSAGSADGFGTNTLVFSLPLTDSLEEKTLYHVTVGADAITDMAGNPYAGIPDSTSWSFTTSDKNATFIESVTSTDTSGIYPIDKDINITLTFSDSVSLTNGNLNVTLETGIIDSVVVIQPFALTRELSFTYTIGLGDFATALDIISLQLDSGALLTNTLGGSVVLNVGGNQNLSASVTIGLDGVPLVFSVSQPVSGTLAPNAFISYSLSKALASGSVNWQQKDSTGNTPVEELIDLTLPFTESMLSAGVHVNENLNAQVTIGKFYDIIITVIDSAGTIVSDTSFYVQLGQPTSSIRIIPGVSSYNLGETVGLQALSVNNNEVISGGVIWTLTGGGQLDSLGNYTATSIGRSVIVAQVEDLLDTLILNINTGSIPIPDDALVIQAADNLKLEFNAALGQNTVLTFSFVHDSLVQSFYLVGPAIAFTSSLALSGTIFVRVDSSLLDTQSGLSFAIYELVDETGPVWKWIPTDIDGDLASFALNNEVPGTYILAQLNTGPLLNAVANPEPAQGEDLQVACLAASEIQNPQLTLEYYVGFAGSSSIPVTYNAGDTSRAAIPGSSVNLNGLIYRCEIKDGTRTRQTEYTEVNVTNKNDVIFSGELLNDVYQGFSLPLKHNNPTVEAMLIDEWGEEDRAVWRLYEYDLGFREMVKQSELEMGNAYWYKMVGRLPAITINAGTAESVPLLTGITRQLNEGWNTFSNPYMYPIILSDIEKHNVSPVMIVYGFPFENEYFPVEPDSTLDPFKLYIIWNGGSGIKILDELIIKGVPVEETQAPAAKQTVLNRGTGFKLRIKGLNSQNGELGLSYNWTGARAARDNWDLPKPGTLGGKVSIDLVVPWSKAPYLTDRRGPLGEGQSWSFVTRATRKDEPMILSLNGGQGMDPKHRAVLLDASRGRVIELTKKYQNEFSYPAAGNRVDEFQLSIGTGAYIEQQIKDFNSLVRVSGLDQNFPNPFMASTTILYQVPRTVPGTRVKLHIYNLKGKRVKTLVDSPVKQGRYTTSWNGRNHHNTKLPAGTYVYRLQIGSEVLQKKLVLLR